MSRPNASESERTSGRPDITPELVVEPVGVFSSWGMGLPPYY